MKNTGSTRIAMLEQRCHCAKGVYFHQGKTSLLKLKEKQEATGEYLINPAENRKKAHLPLT